MSCTHASNCELYVQFAADPSIVLWKTHYCDSDYKRCVRYERSLTGQSVPLNLLPNGKEVVIEVDEYNRGIHALFNAITKNRLSMVKTFLKTKMSSEKVVNAEGVTPLMYAASLGHYDIVQFFLENNCNPHHISKKGETALIMAEQAGHTRCAEILREYMAKTTPPAKDAAIQAPAEVVASRAGQPEHKSGMLGRVLGFLRGSKPGRVDE
ncbi:MAG: ankyrin repeat domain-containing protein [Gammaproteobacteria bacterium]